MPTTETISMARHASSDSGSCAIKRTLFVDDVSQGERGGKRGQPVELEFEIVEITKVAAFHERFVAMKHDAKFGLDHALLTQIADAHHESRPAVQGSDDGRFAEQDARAVGRENRTKMRPVMTASRKTPLMISIVVTM